MQANSNVYRGKNEMNHFHYPLSDSLAGWMLKPIGPNKQSTHIYLQIICYQILSRKKNPCKDQTVSAQIFHLSDEDASNFLSLLCDYHFRYRCNHDSESDLLLRWWLDQAHWKARVNPCI